MLYRTIILGGGAYSDTDWLDPAIVPPDGAPLLHVSGASIVWQLVPVNAAREPVAGAGMTVDARLVSFRDGARVGSPSVVELGGSEVSVSLPLTDTEQRVGDPVRLQLVHVTNPGAVYGLEVHVVKGAVRR